ncbi:MAG: hypothetical protein M3442_06695 [Chloroflexota bacterium]|nr:hypothetical protein [Chloroflexota bacterium]
MCSNIYLVVFFKLLVRNGLSLEEILQAIAVGTVAMVLGDGLTSHLVDRYGPRRPVLVGALIQTAAVAWLPVCSTFAGLVVLEVLIGVSFPAIYGADSKWLRYLVDRGSFPERTNQSMLWVSQLVSAALGCLLLSWEDVACYVSAALYLAGAGVCFFTPDIPPRKGPSLQPATVVELFTGEIGARRLARLIAYGSLLGLMGVSSWLLQYRAFRDFADTPLLFGLVQLLAAGTSLVGSVLPPGRAVEWSALALLSVALYVVSRVAGQSDIGWVAIAFGLLARGAIVVVARERVLAGLGYHQPIARLVFVLNGVAKVSQASAMGVLAHSL